MALTRRAPWWLTYGLVGALVLLFVGERVVSHLQTPRLVLSGAGALFLVAAVLWRAMAWSSARGDDRRVEWLLLLGSLGVLVAVFLYSLSTVVGEKLGLEPSGKLATALVVAWPLLLAIAFLPLLLAQAACSPSRQSGRVEGLRVAEAADSGLCLAFACGALFLGVYIASERNEKVDLSYFRTSMPGSATKNTVMNMEDQLKVLLFFPEVNEVKDEVKEYFSELSRTGRVTIESHDRMLEPKLAEEHKVRTDGAIVLVKGTSSETIRVDPDLSRARNTLRTFDSEVQKALMKVARSSRIAYLTIGHGEMNDRTPSGVGPADPLRSAQIFKRILEAQNYKVKDLGPMQGLSTAIPDDAGVVFVLGPTRTFAEEELVALDKYVERGGALLVATDPESPWTLGSLEGRLGIKIEPVPVVDDQYYMADRRNPADRRIIKTDRFSAHAAVTTLSQAPPGIGIILVGTASITEIPLPGGPEADPEPGKEGKAAPKRTYVVRSMPNAFRDKNGNNAFDSDEKRESLNLVAAVEPGKARVLVMGDGQLVSDPLIGQSELNAYFLADSIKWLGGEEKFQGDTISEKDVEIQHTRSQDVAWFYSTVAGAPALVLAGGLTFVWGRRKRKEKRA